ncbi:MAG: hypothetical protein AAF483_13320 [Planctomycetota bacterium]
MNEPNSSDTRSAHTTEGTAAQAYKEYHEHAEAVLERLTTKHRTLVWIRTVLFGIAGICIFLGFLGDVYQTALFTTGGIFGFGFLAAIVAHEHLRLERLSQESDKKLFEHLLARLSRDWDNVPEQRLLPQHKEVAHADDLDVAGPASLLGLLSLANTYSGDETIQQWLSVAPRWEDVYSRQNAVRALTPERGKRLDILKSLRSARSSKHKPYGLPGWAESPNWLEPHRIAHKLSYVGPFIVFAGIALVIIGVLSGQSWLSASGAITLGIGFLTNILITVFWGSLIHDIFQRVTGEHRGVFEIASVFKMLSELPDSAKANSDCKDLLQDIKHHAAESESSATLGFSKLLTLVRLANFQKDVFLYFVYLVFQLLFLYDFRILKLLEKWKTRFGPHVRDWFGVLGTTEALVSAATLADEYPDWSFASQPESETKLISTEESGHPLLPDSARVPNSLELEANKPLVVVTGSNMAGKSTFLRAIGLNILLARTGAPCCAKSFQTPLYELATSIRVRDSLSDGVSFFMAELKRLKEVVDLASEHAVRLKTAPDTPKILFLLDEILQGTNSQERQIAVATVLEQLLNSQATGLISTHDLDLADANEVKDVSQIVHFREFFEQADGKEVMRFDYKMRSGRTPTTNALKLLKLVGLHDKS